MSNLQLKEVLLCYEEERNGFRQLERKICIILNLDMIVFKDFRTVMLILK